MSFLRRKSVFDCILAMTTEKRPFTRDTESLLTLIFTLFNPAFPEATFIAIGSLSIATTFFTPSFLAAMASMPLPAPTSRKVSLTGFLNQDLGPRKKQKKT